MKFHITVLSYNKAMDDLLVKLGYYCQIYKEHGITAGIRCPPTFSILFFIKSNHDFKRAMLPMDFLSKFKRRSNLKVKD